ncbi:hypothetical protein EVAR_8245_1 [Eumeta japonica]|uniref:Uncharacterized protein n=1 Tax=Eumeta variegata TaxID=151549 RepID=A0A4C1TGS2_EUMVA|nr:hypothetical protein EVAR_8245_1 [Eumeta japonica]
MDKALLHRDATLKLVFDHEKDIAFDIESYASIPLTFRMGKIICIEEKAANPRVNLTPATFPARPAPRRSPSPLSLERILRGRHKTAIGISSTASQQLCGVVAAALALTGTTVLATRPALLLHAGCETHHSQ